MNLENSKTLLVGLWNPHSKYSKTRHNIGADILERLIVQNSLELKLDKSGMYKSGTLIIQENRVDVLIPMVSMNKSGEALKAYLKYKEISPENILIFLENYLDKEIRYDN